MISLSRKYYITYLIVTQAVVLTLGYFLYQRNSDYDVLSRVNRAQRAQTEELKARNTELEGTLAEKDERIAGLRNLFPQYVRESAAILEKVAPALPLEEYKTEEERDMLRAVNNWISEHSVKAPNGLPLLEKNLIILSLEVLEQQEEGGVVEAMYYELPDQKQDEWQVSSFVDRF